MRSSVEWIRMAKFALVGVLNTAVDFAVFSLLYYVTGIPLLAAQTTAFTAGVLNSYALNRKWTFSSSNRGNALEIMRFGAVNGFSFIVATGVLLALRDYGAWYAWLAKLVSVGVSMVLNYTGSRLWVFRQRREAGDG